MKKKRIVLRVENEYLNKKGYLSFLNLDRDGHLDYEMTDSPEKGLSYRTADMKNEHSLLKKHLDVLLSEFPELSVEVEVLVTETMPHDIFEKYKSADF